MTGRSSRPSLDTADSLAVEPGGAEASAERAAEAPLTGALYCGTALPWMCSLT